MRKQRSRIWGRGRASQISVYPLARLMVCLDCGSTLRGWLLRGIRRYRDSAKEHGITCCSAHKSVPAEALEGQAEQILLACADLPQNWKERILDKLQQEAPDYAETEREARALYAKERRLNELYVEGDMDKATCLAKRDDLERQIAALPKVGGSTLVDLERAAALLDDFKALWGRATPNEHEQIYQALFSHIYVRDGVILAIELTRILWALLSRVSDTQDGDDGVRYLLCIKFILYRPLGFGGKSLEQSRAENLIIVISERISRSVLFSDVSLCSVYDVILGLMPLSPS